MKLNLGDIRFHLTNHGLGGGGVNFCNLVRKQKEGEKGTKGFLLEKNGPNHHTIREKQS
jgi:hypothetical protein